MNSPGLLHIPYSITAKHYKVKYSMLQSMEHIKCLFISLIMGQNNTCLLHSKVQMNIFWWCWFFEDTNTMCFHFYLILLLMQYVCIKWKMIPCNMSFSWWPDWQNIPHPNCDWSKRNKHKAYGLLVENQVFHFRIYVFVISSINL